MPEAAILLALAGLVAAALGWLLAARAGGRARRLHADAASRAELAEQAARQAEASLIEVRGRSADLEGRHRDAEAEGRRLHSEAAGLRRGLEGLGERLDEARGERGAIQGRLDEALREIRALEGTNRELSAKLDAGARAHRDEVALLKGLRQEMSDRFQALADETLKLHGASFGQANREQIAALLTPMREQVRAFQDELRAAHEGAGKDRERLKTEIEQLSRRSEEVGREAVALTRALKGEKQRQGAWGEMILERLLEDSGLERGTHYEVQRTLRDEEGGRWRPDVIVRMPDGRAVVIDAKVSLVAYERAVNADDPGERAAALREHAAAVRRHVDDLAARDYGGLARGSVDYVLMFMPIEGALAAALMEEGDLTSHALRRGVGVMTPTTLMVALRTVEHVWAVERRESNAEAIADRAGKLYDKMVLFTEAMQEVGRHLGQAQGAHDTAMSRLSTGGGNLLGQADKLKKLGARTTKAIPVEFDAEPDDPPRIEAAE